ncbi:MAG: PEGA domain-containing protein, partial [Candidatus Nitrotoga sp.]
MKSVYVLFLLMMPLTVSINAYAAGSVLSVNCKGDDEGAEVLVNGKFKGECPLDIKVPVGKLKLKVQ